LASFAVPSYRGSRERALDNEANSNLTLIQAAENLYKIENSAFYGSNVHNDLNSTLNVSLSLSANPAWQYQTTVNAAGTAVCAQATRNVAGGRSWHLNDTDNDATTGPC
jgi:Tfp pilus assembly protein PilE